MSRHRAIHSCIPGLLILALLTGCGGGGSSGAGDTAPPPVVVAGQINIEANSRVDSDTADNLDQGLATTNNSLAAPQFVPSVLLAAGYLSGSSGSYPPIGNNAAFAFRTDIQDVFELPLLPGQNLALQTFNTRADALGGPTQVNVSIRRRNFPYATVAFANTVGEDFANVALPTEEAVGNYLVALSVADDSKPIRYVLSTSPVADASGMPLTWPDAPFVTGEAIVKVGDNVALASALKRAPMKTIRQLDPQHRLVRMESMKSRSTRDPLQQTIDWIESLRDEPEIASAQPNYLLYSQNSPTTEPLYLRQWHYGLINAPIAWQLAPEGGAGVTVAVLDTGLFRSGGQWHPDLDANVVNPLPDGADLVSGSLDDDDEHGPDDNPADPGDPVGGSVYHGTHVAGTIAARADNNLGGTGIAYGASLLPVRVLSGSGTGSAADLLDAIRWVSGAGDDDVPKADIVNMSLGGLPFLQPMQNAIITASNKGVIFVAAAGNQNSGIPSYPAAFNHVFSVSATDGAGNKSGYSNFGSTIDLAAPGGDALRDANADGRADVVVSSSASRINGILQPTYIGLQGTSMAAPHVAGVFALMKSLNPDLDEPALRAMLENGDLTEDIGTPGRDNLYGYGLIDAGKAVLSALSGEIPKLLSPSPASLNFSNGSQLLELRLAALQGEVTLTGLSGPDWLDVSPRQLPGPTSEFILELALRNDLVVPDQLTQGLLAINYEDDDGLGKLLEVRVVAQILSDEFARNAGDHFVLLVKPEPNPDTGFYEAVGQAAVTADNGSYNFSFIIDENADPNRFDTVPPGDYFLVAGTDLDNDGVICSDGEACAEYPIAGLRQVITLEAGQSLTGIELTTSYARPVLSESVLPRPGFKGYQLRSPGTAQQTPRSTR